MNRPLPASAWWLSAWGAGVVVLLAGTFLPWLYSGQIPKNSYQLAGIGQRRLSAPGWVEAVLGTWPFLGPLWAMALVVLLLRLRRWASGLSIIFALITGVVAVAVLVVGGRRSSSLIYGSVSGPAVTAAGALLVLIAGIAMLRSAPRSIKFNRIESNGPTVSSW